MTAPQPAPGSDREVPWCNLPFCPAWAQRGEHRIETDRCIVDRPAAPSEPPAADSPTPGTEYREANDADWMRAYARLHDRHGNLAPVDTEPPAETPQGDLKARITRGATLAMQTYEVGYEAGYAAALAARPSADTENLREQVETWIDEAPEQTAGLDLLRQIIGRPR